MTKRKHLTQEEYNMIKELQTIGVEPGRISKVTNRSYPTISRIRRSNDYEEYKTFTVPKAVVVEPLSEVATDEPQRTHFSEDSVNLERIASALERLALAWEAHPQTTKRSIFTKG